jgi:hypothetical protein
MMLPLLMIGRGFVGAFIQEKGLPIATEYSWGKK